MTLKEWRIARGWSQGQLGEALGFVVDSRSSQAERIENGKIKADADLVAAIERLTDGSVLASDMHATRLAWLEANGRARDFAVPSSDKGQAA